MSSRHFKPHLPLWLRPTVSTSGYSPVIACRPHKKLLALTTIDLMAVRTMIMLIDANNNATSMRRSSYCKMVSAYRNSNFWTGSARLLLSDLESSLMRVPLVA